MNPPFRTRPAVALTLSTFLVGALALTAVAVNSNVPDAHPDSAAVAQLASPAANKSVNALGFSAPAGTLYQRQRFVDTSPEAVRRNDALLTTLSTANGGVRPAAKAQKKKKAAEPRPISRDEVIARALSWVDAKVPYCQTRWYTNRFGTYRQDCSGYVSMAWAAEEFYTGSVLEQATPIAWRNLRIGDALYYHHSGNKGHIMLFMGWANASATTMVVWHSTSTTNACPMADGARAGVFSTAQIFERGYSPIRYNLITDGPAPVPTVTVTAKPTVTVTATPSNPDLPGPGQEPAGKAVTRVVKKTSTVTRRPSPTSSR